MRRYTETLRQQLQNKIHCYSTQTKKEINKIELRCIINYCIVFCSW